MQTKQPTFFNLFQQTTIMNEQPQGAQLSSTYPLAPMDYVNMYTNENIKSDKAPPPPPIIKVNFYYKKKLFNRTNDLNKRIIIHVLVK